MLDFLPHPKGDVSFLPEIGHLVQIIRVDHPVDLLILLFFKLSLLGFYLINLALFFVFFPLRYAVRFSFWELHFTHLHLFF
jgi:hypothetical protein